MYIRKLPSGNFQCTVRDPSGKRHSETFKLKSQARHWGTEQEARFNRGDRRDPRAGQIKLGDWRDRVTDARGLELPTRAKSASIWRTHCEAAWASWPMNAVTRMEAQQWVNRLRVTKVMRHRGRSVEDDGEVPFLSAATIHEAVHTMSVLYMLALKEDPPLVTSNPFAKLDLPKIQPRPVEFYEHEEADQLYDALEGKFGLKWRTLAELGMHVGLRPGEIYGLHGNRVDWTRGLVHVTHVMTRYGLREYPKSKKSHRSVPVPPHTLTAMAKLMEGRDAFALCTCPRVAADGTRTAGQGPCRALVFPSAGGGPIDDSRFRSRVWYPAVDAAGIRKFPPKIMRHTAASWLVLDGVPLYDVQHLLGHERSTTTERYAHLAPDAHGKVVESWKRRASSAESDARLTHERKEARPS